MTEEDRKRRATILKQLERFRANKKLMEVLKQGDFSFTPDTIGSYIHLSRAPSLRAEAEKPEMAAKQEMLKRLTREEVIAAVKAGRSLAGADLTKADLSGVDLGGADLNRANLSVTDLNRANLSRADLSRAHLLGANLNRADLSEANLSGANLSGADLNRANLSGADLNRANLSGADLNRANLSGANLSRADLSRASLSGADLSRAHLLGADLVGADLRGAKIDVESIDLSATIGWREAKWDEDIFERLLERFGKEEQG